MEKDVEKDVEAAVLGCTAGLVLNGRLCFCFSGTSPPGGETSVSPSQGSGIGEKLAVKYLDDEIRGWTLSFLINRNY